MPTLVRALPMGSVDPDAVAYARSNVHIGGLIEARLVTERDLRAFGSAYGNVMSVKIVLDRAGQPKGTGFVRFATEQEAARFVKICNSQGLPADFARVRDPPRRLTGQPSYKTALSARQDEASSNIYLANMPTSWTNDDVSRILLAGFIVHSIRILYEGDKPGQIAGQQQKGRSRGVGFARLDSRQMAAEAIERINGLIVPGCTLPLQARFADSDAQRAFKRQTRGPVTNGLTQTAPITNGFTQHTPFRPTSTSMPSSMPPVLAPLSYPPIAPAPQLSFSTMPSAFPQLDLPRSPSMIYTMPTAYARSAGMPTLPTPPLPPASVGPFSPTAPVFVPAKTALGISSSAPVPRSGSSGSLRRTNSVDGIRV